MSQEIWTNFAFVARAVCFSPPISLLLEQFSKKIGFLCAFSFAVYSVSTYPQHSRYSILYQDKSTQFTLSCLSAVFVVNLQKSSQSLQLETVEEGNTNLSGAEWVIHHFCAQFYKTSHLSLQLNVQGNMGFVCCGLKCRLEYWWLQGELWCGECADQRWSLSPATLAHLGPPTPTRPRRLRFEPRSAAGPG